VSDLLNIIQGDWFDVSKQIADESINTCVTSPPYYGLRDYGTAKWEGGDDGCDHEAARSRTGFDYALSEKQQSSKGTDVKSYKPACPCGAARVDSQIGIESTPEAYVERLVEAFREVRRVLRKDGTLWLNLGDSYANDTKWGGSTGGKHAAALHGSTGIGRGKKQTGLKSKDLIGIPWMVAFALRADGWYLRSDIIWHKPNPMPESVTDRPTKAHEYIFLLSKSANYYYDADAIKEKAEWQRENNPDWQDQRSATNEKKGAGNRNGKSGGFTNWDTSQGRNKRSVWTVNTRSYSGAHFATFPPKLIEPCILAGCPQGGVVLDPFAGSGTTGKVALELGRRAVLVELNPEYIALCNERTQTTLGLPFSLLRA